MPRFSKNSKLNLVWVHPTLKSIFEIVIKKYDCVILTGYRGELDQNTLFHNGFSKLMFPKSKHNIKPSLAVDVAPYPINWNDTKSFYHFAGYVKGVADSLNIDLIWGGDWDNDNDLNDQNFFDLIHFELNEKYITKLGVKDE